MAKQPITSSRSAQTQDQIEEFATLDRLLHISAGTPSFSFAICNSPALRNYLIQRISSSHPGVLVVPIPSGTVDVYGVILESTGKSVPEAIFVTGIEDSISSGDKYPPTLRSLNASRDLWGPRYPCPVVIWMPEYVAALVPTVAPDLWRYKSHSFEFVSDSMVSMAELPSSTEGYLMLAGNLDADQKQFRIAELEARIKEAGDPPSESLLPHARLWIHELAHLYSEIGELNKSEALNKTALIIEQAQGNAGIQAVHLGDLGLLAWRRGELDKAEQLTREALKLNRQVKSVERQAACLGNLGGIAHVKGDLERAEKFYREALDLYQILDDSKWQAPLLSNLGLIALESRRLSDARALMEESLAINRALGDIVGQAKSLGNLGVIAEHNGDLAAAESFYEASLRIDRQLGRLEGQAASIGNLGVLASRRGDFDKAKPLFKEALTIERQLGNLRGQAITLSNLGSIAEEQGKPEEARQLLSEAKDLFSRIGIPKSVAQLELRLAEL